MSDGAYLVNQPPVRVRERANDFLPRLDLASEASKGELTVVPATPPAADARDLFLLMERLDRGMDAAAHGKGSFPGATLLDRLHSWRFGWGAAVTLTTAVVSAFVFRTPDPAAFVLGAIAGGAASVGVRYALSWLNDKLRERPASVESAKPLLQAFETRDPATQRLVADRAGLWANRLTQHDVTGQDLRQQLRELAKVGVKVDDVTQRRLAAITALISHVPGQTYDAETVDHVITQLQRLDPEDRAQIAELMRERLYEGEKLRGFATPRDNERLYNALVATQPRPITTSEALQKLVADDGGNPAAS